MIEPRFGHAESGFYFAKLTWHSEIKRKASFPFVFLSFFRNFVRILSFSLYKGSLGD